MGQYVTVQNPDNTPDWRLLGMMADSYIKRRGDLEAAKNMEKQRYNRLKALGVTGVDQMATNFDQYGGAERQNEYIAPKKELNYEGKGNKTTEEILRDKYGNTKTDYALMAEHAMDEMNRRGIFGNVAENLAGGMPESVPTNKQWVKEGSKNVPPIGIASIEELQKQNAETAKDLQSNATIPSGNNGNLQNPQNFMTRAESKTDWAQKSGERYSWNYNFKPGKANVESKDDLLTTQTFDPEFHGSVPFNMTDLVDMADKYRSDMIATGNTPGATPVDALIQQRQKDEDALNEIYQKRGTYQKLQQGTYKNASEYPGVSMGETIGMDNYTNIDAGAKVSANNTSGNKNESDDYVVDAMTTNGVKGATIKVDRATGRALQDLSNVHVPLNSKSDKTQLSGKEVVQILQSNASAQGTQLTKDGDRYKLPGQNGWIYYQNGKWYTNIKQGDDVNLWLSVIGQAKRLGNQVDKSDINSSGRDKTIEETKKIKNG